MKTWVLEYSLWVYGLIFALMGSGFILLENKKGNKETCAATHKAVDQRLESMDKKLDKLLDLHLNGTK